MFGTNSFAGITCIEFDPVDSNYFWVGNFDHQMRKYDLRMMQIPLVKLNTGGSIWRILAKDDLVTVAMSGPNKYQIYQKIEGSEDLIMRFEDSDSHKSMVYGVDFLKNSQDLVDVWSCSFYDGLLIRRSISLID